MIKKINIIFHKHFIFNGSVKLHNDNFGNSTSLNSRETHEKSTEESNESVNPHTVRNGPVTHSPQPRSEVLKHFWQWAAVMVWSQRHN